MDLYEYQGKQIFATFGIPVSEGRVATTPEEARRAAEELRGPVVVKAQVRLHVDPLEGYQPWIGRRPVYGAGIDDPGEQKQLAPIIEKLYRCSVECDAMLTEINPLIVTPDGVVKALDSKFTVDDSSLY